MAITTDPKEAMKAQSQRVEQDLSRQFPEFDFTCTIGAKPKSVSGYRVRGGVTVPLKSRQPEPVKAS